MHDHAALSLLVNYIQNAMPLTPELLAEFGNWTVAQLAEEYNRACYRNGLRRLEEDEST